MDLMQTIVEIIKYTLPALIVLASSYLIVKKFLVAQMQRKQIALFKDSQDITLRLRLQAYERLIVFVERISPRSIATRVYDPSMTVVQFQFVITTTIRSEFEHNLSQQIYVSQNVWETVKKVKEQEINMVNQVSRSLNPDAPAKELHSRIMDIVLKTDDELPTDVALHVINEEVKTVLSFGQHTAL
jgi:hypothetical protein